MVTISVNLSNPISANIDISVVTDEQIGKAHKCFGPDNQPFYLVENSAGKTDDQGDLIEYKVSFSLELHSFTCTCRAGKCGFSNCSQGSCWHVRAALACEQEVRAAVAEQERYQAAASRAARCYAEVNGRQLSSREYEDLTNRQPVKLHSRAKGFSPRPFSILR